MKLTPLHTGPLGVNTWIVPLNMPGSEQQSESDVTSVLVIDPAGCALCGDEHVVTGFLAQNRLKPAAVILTHGHFDHVAGLPAVKACYPDVPVLIHHADADCIGADSVIRQQYSLNRMGMEDFLAAVSRLPEADAFLEDNKTLAESIPAADKLTPAVQAALAQWHIIHTPGHSPGSVCLFNKEENVLISGDTVFYQSYGRTDLYGGDEQAILASIRRLLADVPGEARVYPGHEAYGFTLGDNYQ